MMRIEPPNDGMHRDAFSPDAVAGFGGKNVPKHRGYALILGIVALLGIGAWAAAPRDAQRPISRYSTSLKGRTASQTQNAKHAAERLNGAVVLPGQTFSFLKTVGPWTADVGYERAPVSYNGEMVRAFGGGVCQASSTLYNAALLAGLEIVERHRHHWPAKYAPMGRDAAVAHLDIDLRFTNNHPRPITIHSEVQGGYLVCEIVSSWKPASSVRLRTETLSMTPSRPIVLGSKDSGERLQLLNRGHPGYEVVTYRVFESPEGPRSELVSRDSYPAMNRVYRTTQW